MPVADDVSVTATVAATAIGRDPELTFDTKSNVVVIDAVKVEVRIEKSPVLQSASRQQEEREDRPATGADGDMGVGQEVARDVAAATADIQHVEVP